MSSESSQFLQAKKTLPGWREVLRISWPLIIANSFWNLQLTVDRIFLGNYSTDALGAAMAVMGVFWTPMALVQQTAAYSMTFVAQYWGAKQFKNIGPAIWQAIYLSLFGGLLFYTFMPFSEKLFTWIGHSPNLQTLESDYFRSLCHSALPAALIAVASGFFTGLGKSHIIMWINGLGLLVNVVLDYLLIFGKFGFPALGISGAGYATALANWAGALFGFYLLFFHKRHDKKAFSLFSLSLNWSLLKRFVKFGVPSGLQWSLEGLAFTVFLIFVGRMPNGDAALAASGIAVTVMMLAVLPAFGVGQGVSVLVGQYLGENEPGIAEASTWSGLRLAAVYIVSVGMTFLLFPSFYLSWFYNAENMKLWSEVSTIVPILLMFVGIFVAFDSMNLVFSFALKGAGDTRFVSFVALTLPWPLMILPTWLVSKWENGVYWAWFAASIFIVTQAFVFLQRFRRGKWKQMRVI